MINQEAIRYSIEKNIAFNLIFLKTFTKLDIFIQQFDEYNKNIPSRAVQTNIGTETQLFWVKMCSPEDIVLHKLNWYKLSNGQSITQLADIRKVIMIKNKTIDFEYMNKWAKFLDLQKYLQQILDNIL